MKNLTAFALATFLALFSASNAVKAQAYPSKMITIVVPLAAGTAMDLLTRFYASELQKSLGQPVIVSNQPGAGMMLATRALGFDIGAMSGIDNAKVDNAFLAGTTFRSNFLCTIGHADESALFPRLPRFTFDDVCKIM